MADDVSKEDRLLAALSYPFWPLAFLILNLSPVLKRQRFVRYHAFQGFFLGMAIWIGAILLGTAAAFLGRFLWPIGFLYYLFSKLMGLAAFAVTAWSSYQAWTGRCHVLPYITDFAKPFVEEAALAVPEIPTPLDDPAVTRDLVERAPVEEPPAPEKPRRRPRQTPPGEPQA